MDDKPSSAVYRASSEFYFARNVRYVAANGITNSRMKPTLSSSILPKTGENGHGCIRDKPECHGNGNADPARPFAGAELGEEGVHHRNTPADHYRSHNSMSEGNVSNRILWEGVDIGCRAEDQQTEALADQIG